AWRRCRKRRTSVDEDLPRLAHLFEGKLELALELQHLTAGEAEQRQLDMVAARERLDLGHGTGRHAHYVAARRLAEKRSVETQRRLRANGRTAHAEPAEEAALRQRDEHASLGDVMGGVEISALGGGEDQAVHRLLACEVESGRSTRHVAVLDLEVFRAAEVVVAGPDHEDEIAVLAEP